MIFDEYKEPQGAGKAGSGAGGEKPPRGFSMGMYVFGAAAADYGWIALTHPHYAHRSMGYVLRTLRSLSARRPAEPPELPAPGYRHHYLCDFCCRVHEPEHLTGLREHVDYEIALEKRLLQRQEELSRLAGELAGRLALSRTIESAGHGTAWRRMGGASPPWTGIWNARCGWPHRYAQRCLHSSGFRGRSAGGCASAGSPGSAPRK